jgi:aminomethyltransferase
MSEPRKTALYDRHVAFGGKIVDFSGWALPIQYEGLVAEHNAVRNEAGVFDVSHMGEVDVKGSGARDFVQNLVTNDVDAIVDGQICYCAMCYPDGGTVDDLLVYKRNNEDFLLVINAANIDKDFAWMQENSKGFEISLENISDDISEIAIQGPKAQAILQLVCETDLKEIPFFFFKEKVRVAGIECLVSRTGYTGEDGFEVYTSNDDIVAVWDALFEAGKEEGLKPAGLGARDTLRFEATLPLYGNELSKDVSPLEAGIGMFVKLGKEGFIGKEALAKQKEEGLKRKTVGFEMIDKGIPRHEYPVLKDGQVIGHVTTGYQAPTVGKTIGLALIDAAHGEMGSEFEIQVRKKTAKAKIISKRFYQKNYKK